MRKQASIKRQLFGVLVYCWVVPVIAISIICLLYIQTVVKSRIESTVHAGAVYAAQMTTTRLDTAVEDMRSVIFDGYMRDIYDGYMRSRNIAELQRRAGEELSQRFRLRTEYMFVGVSFSGAPSELISVSQYGDSAAAYFAGQLMDSAFATLEEGDSRAHILVDGSSIYLYQNLLSSTTLEKLGVVIFQLVPTSLFQYFYEMDPSPEYAMLQLNDQIFWTTALPESGEKLATATIKAAEADSIETRGGYITASSLASHEDYTLGYRLFVDDNIITERTYSVVLIVIGLCSVVLPLLGYGLFSVYRRITEPIDALVVATERIENERWDTTIVTTSDNEFGRLISSFNKMSSKIKYLFDYAYREELAASEARLRMLQSQINPHFLNNTLELINWKARLAGNDEISLMIESLGSLLNASMDRKGEKVVTLREELSYVNSYLLIIEKRFGRRLTVNQHVNERLLDSMVPRLIIQPLIENAVVHGVEPAASGTIDVRVGRMNRELAIEIINDGEPLSAEDEERISAILHGDYYKLTGRERRLGIKNVQERLSLMYGEAGTLTIQRMSDGKTLARVCLPIQAAGETPKTPSVPEGE